MQRRRLVVPVAALVVVLIVPLLFGHRGTHAALSFLVPGSGLFGTHTTWGVVLLATFVVCALAWLRWGATWLPVLCTAVSVVLSVVWSSPTNDAAIGSLRAVPMAHEFPLVVLVVGALSAARRWLVRLPGARRVMRWLGDRRSRRITGIADLPVVLRCRVVAVQAVCAGEPDASGRARTALARPDVAERCRRVTFIARGRWPAQPLERDHAGIRSAIVLCATDGSDGERAALIAEGHDSWAGVPCSEPGWLRLLDVVLAAVACGDDHVVRECVRELLHNEFGLHGGHRAGAVWAPFGIRVSRAHDWEHALAAALARKVGLLDNDADWWAIRQRALGAAARGTSSVDDERMIAAARLWLTMVDDSQAAAIVMRPTVGRDPLARVICSV